MTGAPLWLLLNLISVMVLSFFSMVEMACVSINRVRLQYYVSKGIKQAIWLNYLLHNPSRLFGTTLIGVNVALVIGSECSREFHQAIGVSPDLAPFSQVILVVIFGELAPMFAARRYPENVAMLGVPIVYGLAKLMTPLLWTLHMVSKFFNFFLGGKNDDAQLFLSQEELFKILEEQDEDKPFGSETEEFNAIATNILSLYKKDARQIMTSIKEVPLIPSNFNIAQTRHLFQKINTDYIPMYHKETRNIVGIVFPRDLIRIPDARRTRDFVRPPWFITEHTKIDQILQQFRHNNARVAIVLDDKGLAVGILKLDDIVEEIFGNVLHTPSKDAEELVIDRNFSGEMTVGEFNKQFNVVLDSRTELTLSELVSDVLGHHPDPGESIYLEPFELTVEETTLLDVKTINISTHLK